MNMLEANVARQNGGVVLDLGGDQKLQLDAADIAGPPALAAYDGRPVILGIRPEGLEEASLVDEAPPGRRLTGRVELREALGSELMVHFALPRASSQRRRKTKELADETSVEGGIVTPGALIVGRFGRPRGREGRRERRSGRRHALAPLLRPGDRSWHL